MEQFIEEKTENETYTAEAEKESDEGKQDFPLKKFKDVQSLQNAYSSLESEFTKRSQKLKELKRERDELSRLLKIKQNSFDEEQLNRRRSAKEFIDLFPEAQEIFNAQNEGESENVSQNDLVVTYVKYLQKQLEDEKQKLQDEKFLYGQIEGSSIKDKIIKDYLSNVKTCVKINRLMEGGGEFSLAPPIKPKTIEEAGMLAKDILKKKN